MAKVTLLFYRAFDNPHATLLDKLVAWIDGGSHSPRHRASGSRDWRSSEKGQLSIRHIDTRESRPRKRKQEQ